MLNKKYALNSECALNRKGLGIEGGAIYRVWYPTIGGAKIAKIAIEEYTIESVIRGRHVYIRAFGILYWESSSLLRERMAIAMTDIRHLDHLLQL